MRKIISELIILLTYTILAIFIVVNDIPLWCGILILLIGGTIISYSMIKVVDILFYNYFVSQYNLILENYEKDLQENKLTPDEQTEIEKDLKEISSLLDNNF